MNYRQQVIADNIEARENEIAVYDINIFNYTYVLSRPVEPELEGFVEEIRERCRTEVLERRKAEIILQALNAQLHSLKSEGHNQVHEAQGLTQ